MKVAGYVVVGLVGVVGWTGLIYFFRADLKMLFARFSPQLAVAACTMAIVVSGSIDPYSLMFVWPMFGCLAGIVSHRWGAWNYGDPLPGQFFLAAMIIVLPFLGFFVLGKSLREA